MKKYHYVFKSRGYGGFISHFAYDYSPITYNVAEAKQLFNTPQYVKAYCKGINDVGNLDSEIYAVKMTVKQIAAKPSDFPKPEIK